MRGFTVALFFVLTCIGSTAAVRAADTPTPSPTANATAATSALPIFGYFAPNKPNDDPLSAALAGDVMTQVGETLHVNVASLSGGELSDAIKAKSCAKLGLSGYVIASSNFQFYRRQVGAETTLKIVDCAGHPYFQGIGSHTERRDPDIVLPTQDAGAQSKAVAAAVGNALDYQDGHKDAWNRLVHTGLVDASTAPNSTSTTKP
jgi:hypothetical protein